eukprot:CAMPEP_0197624066 /NCGR_PEP_ID=MMETSP1338-20131121/3869_1 /TAXON_ID=43686 ORGANISM="Pelagodinium beii, Strain RCC1491" /NCGR_SAMPLE_ID=MMETSP1338 /ASSEMBLY_ACC=CAM_ASM_000754 /LENGTH=141 /DNA_ID=CAMNT_0043194163 /DNA_START=94 /DNA_END=516 /DNA_ORIENTATION=+
MAGVAAVVGSTAFVGLPAQQPQELTVALRGSQAFQSSISGSASSSSVGVAVAGAAAAVLFSVRRSRRSSVVQEMGGQVAMCASGPSSVVYGSNNSQALPWAPVPEGLTNNEFGEYVGDVGFDPLGFAKNQRLLPWYREAEL